MFKPCWLERLAQMSERARVAVVGMGHELRGDDGAGVAVARALGAAARNDERLLVIDAGPAPENQIGPLLRFVPDVVLFVDAVEMGEAPGTVRWVPWCETDGAGGSTHTLSPQVLAQFLMRELGCEVLLLGIQPASCAVGAQLSPEVAEAVHDLARSLSSTLSCDRSSGGPRDVHSGTDVSHYP
jgi:hydrogenase 3 maturation protease